MVNEILRRNRTITTSVTRPADTTAYAAGDVLSDSTSAPTVLTFPKVARDRGLGSVITGITVIGSAASATKPDLELWLFDTAPAAENDNGAFAPSDAEVEKVVAVIAIPVASFKVGNAGSGAAGNIVYDVGGLAIPVNAVAGKTDLYGMVVVRNAYTPVSGEKLTFRLKVLD